MFEIGQKILTNLITPRALFFLYFYPWIKYELDRMNRCRWPFEIVQDARSVVGRQINVYIDVMYSYSLH